MRPRRDYLTNIHAEQRGLPGISQWDQWSGSDQWIAMSTHKYLWRGHPFHAAADLREESDLLQAAKYGADGPAALSPAFAGDAFHHTISKTLIGYIHYHFAMNDRLIPAIAQDWKTGEVLMLAYMNDEALARTRETGRAHYWSRSRKKLWLKGESSGHFQLVREIRIDCDEDAILLMIEQEGGACHTGYRSCFYRTIDGKVVGEKVFDPQDVY
jgi:phosphoribosyl-AMP cyclohydrolase